jgi:hypothetical protein
MRGQEDETQNGGCKVGNKLQKNLTTDDTDVLIFTDRTKMPGNSTGYKLVIEYADCALPLQPKCTRAKC